MSKLAIILGAAGLVGAGTYVLTSNCSSCRAPEAAPETVTLVNTPANLAVFEIDAGHSSVNYCISHMNVSNHWGRFNELSGTFFIDPASPSDCSIDVQIPVASIDSNSEGRDKHLLTADFFSVAEFPTISFKSSKFTSTGENTLDVEGTLTLHGTTKPVTAKVEFLGTGPGRGGSELAGLEASFTIKRSDFGMNKMVGPIGDEVKVIVSLEGGR